MKKPTPFLRRRLQRLAVIREHERATKRPKSDRREKLTEYPPPASSIRAPRRVDILHEHAKSLRDFLRAIAHQVLKDNKSTILDFRETEGITVAGAILMFAEIDRVCSLSALDKPITLLDPRRTRPREVLKQIGIHEMTGDTCNTVPHRDDVVYWKATKGRDQSGDNIAMIEHVANSVEGQYDSEIVLTGLWRGVSEAVANSVDHAYKKPRSDGFHGLADVKWWMFTQVRNGEFMVAVCDLGCGYRATVGETLPERFLSEFMAAFTGDSQDARAIEAAMEYGRSGTSEGHRGKGSRDALTVLEMHRNGHLMIMSNAGFVSYEFRNGVQHRHQSGSLPVSIKGTIVWWRLPLQESPNENN